jgi:type IV pilus assembly protein PilM
MLFGKQVLLGIDSGHHSVKLALLSSNKKDILDLAEAEVFPDRQFLEDATDEEKIIEATREALKKFSDPSSKLRPRIISSISDEAAICRYIELPRMDKAKLEVAQQTMMTKQVPFSLQEAICTDLQVPPLSGEKGNIGTFFMAIKKESLTAQKNLMQKVGIEVNNYEISTLSIIKEFVHNHGKGQDETTAIVVAGSHITTVIVINNGSPYYMRNFVLGGSNLTYAFQMGAQCSWREAEEHKKAFDAMQNEVAIEPALSKWMEQVKKSIEAFKKLEPKRALSVEKIYLTGGTSRLKGLDSRLGDYLGIPVIVDSWLKIKPPSRLQEFPAGSFCIALGICL